MALTHINDLLEQVRTGQADSLYIASDDWAQGRATFGGLLGGMIYTAMRREIQDERPLYSFMLSFVGPIAAGEPFNIKVNLLRKGRNAIQMEAKIIQNNQVACSALACFGTARTSQINVTSHPAPSAPTPDQLRVLSYIPNITPAFTQHIDFCWAFGGLPFSGTLANEMGGWMRFNDDQRIHNFDVAHLITLIDAWPPAVLMHLKQYVPASSMTWNIAFMNPLPSMPTDWLLYRAEIEQAANGYGQTVAKIWNRQGELLAISQQTVAVFDVS